MTNRIEGVQTARELYISFEGLEDDAEHTRQREIFLDRINKVAWAVSRQADRELYSRQHLKKMHKGGVYIFDYVKNSTKVVRANFELVDARKSVVASVEACSPNGQLTLQGVIKTPFVDSIQSSYVSDPNKVVFCLPDHNGDTYTLTGEDIIYNPISPHIDATRASDVTNYLRFTVAYIEDEDRPKFEKVVRQN